MSIIGFEKETYLFVNGLYVDHEIQLREGITLLPVTSEIDNTIASKLIKKDIDYSIMVLAASNLYAQLRIVAESEEKLALEAWNAQWDCLLLGAIINNSIMSNLQCDKPIESLEDASILRVTNYELRGIKGISKQLTLEDEQWIRNHYKKAMDLLEEQHFQTAVHCLSTYLWHSLPRVQLAILWPGIESLFNVNNEVSFRISIYVANFLCGNNKEQAKSLFEKVKKMYGARSAAVHGGIMKESIDELVSESATLLNAIIKNALRLEEYRIQIN